MSNAAIDMLSGKLLDELVGPLYIHFRASWSAYQDYIANGKTFLWASSLKRINAGALSLLRTKAYLLPEQSLDDALALIRHYDAWLTSWNDFADRMAPALSDPFVFANDVRYPREAEANLIRLYESIKIGSAS